MNCAPSPSKSLPARYVYYGCTRGKDLHCKGGYIREGELISQLISIIDKIDVNEIGMRYKFEEEIKRFQKFQKGVLGIKESPKTEKEIDIRTYAKYLLREGSVIEKRELLSTFKSKLTIKDKKIFLGTWK